MVANISVDFASLQDALDEAMRSRDGGRDMEAEAVTEALQEAAMPLLRAYLFSTAGQRDFMQSIEDMVGNMLGITASLVQQGLLHGHDLTSEARCTCDDCVKPAKAMH
jgi:hypothetical protein